VEYALHVLVLSLTRNLAPMPPLHAGHRRGDIPRGTDLRPTIDLRVGTAARTAMTAAVGGGGRHPRASVIVAPTRAARPLQKTANAAARQRA